MARARYGTRTAVVLRWSRAGRNQAPVDAHMVDVAAGALQRTTSRTPWNVQARGPTMGAAPVATTDVSMPIRNASRPALYGSTPVRRSTTEAPRPARRCRSRSARTGRLLVLDRATAVRARQFRPGQSELFPRCSRRFCLPLRPVGWAKRRPFAGASLRADARTRTGDPFITSSDLAISETFDEVRNPCLSGHLAFGFVRSASDVLLTSC